ncbi:efflux RND transporter periplasmic adaptor subunit [Vibrio sp. 99-8-1]|uniref:efflux RND transporter periplasmic adaptor subunit n=1 Tax=Vibrio sp. 99-8-1 TaxID=2607602 RepID=UPI0020A3E99B|nr:efflux RND transporter periplasmic adaptor subunit [Vibrio sp. 99-8-1]
MKWMFTVRRPVAIKQVMSFRGCNLTALFAVLFSHITYADSVTADTMDINLINDAQLSCLLAPSREVELSSAVQGVVKSLPVELGDRVKKGQVVMTLDSTVEQAALNTVKARLEFASRKVERNADLFKKNLISDNEQDEMLTEQRLAAFQLTEVRVRLQQRKTMSPLDGVVVEKLKEPGEFVDETPFLRIVSLNPMHAEVVLPAEYYGEINRGRDVTLITSGDNARFKGKIKTVDPVIDAASNTFAIIVQLDNKKGQLTAGLRCRVELSPAE